MAKFYVRAEQDLDYCGARKSFYDLMIKQNFCAESWMRDSTLYRDIFAFKKTKCSFDASSKTIEVILAYHMMDHFSSISVDVEIVNENGERMPNEFEKIGEWLGGKHAKTFFKNWKQFAIKAGWYKAPESLNLQVFADESDDFF